MGQNTLRKSEEENAAGSAPTPAKAETKRSRPMSAVKGLSMEKWLCLGAMGASGLMLLLFVLDLVLGFPFGGLSKIVDIFAILACAIVLYLGWDASKDLS